MSRVTDLDVVVPEDRPVRLGGEEYMVPGDIPLEIFLRLNNVGGDEENEVSESDAAEGMIVVLGDLFAWCAPEVAQPAIREKVVKVIRGRGVKFMLGIVEAIYKEDEEAEVIEGEATEVPTPAEAGTPS